MDLGFCSECGKPLQTGEKFCANCGHRFESQQVEVVKTTQKPQHTENVQISKMSKKKKIVIGIVAAIAIALFSAHTYINSTVSTEKQIAAINEALHEGTVKSF